MELTQLLQFKTIAECKTMTAAAEKLHISQPALSAGLKKLEEELGIQLFERKKNNISLNKAGEMAFTYTCAILGQVEEMKNAFRQYSKENNNISLGFCDPGPMRFATPLLQQDNPELEISSEIVADDSILLNDLLSHRYDAVVSLENFEYQDVISIPFAKEQLMLSVPIGDELANKTSVNLHLYPNREFAVYRMYCAYEQKMKNFMDWLVSLPHVTVYTDYFVFRQMLEHKNLLSFTTRLVQFYRNDGERVIIPLEDEEITATYWFSYIKDNKKRMQPFISWIEKNSLMLLGTESHSYK